MSPQEKAKQLVEKYLNLSVNVIHTDCEGDISIAAGTPTQSHAKQCALIAVDEIIDSEALEPQQKRHIIQNVPPIKCQLEYWFKVKTEIEKTKIGRQPNKC